MTTNLKERNMDYFLYFVKQNAGLAFDIQKCLKFQKMIMVVLKL